MEHNMIRQLHRITNTVLGWQHSVCEPTTEHNSTATR